MRPILFSLGRLSVPSYGAAIALGAGLGIWFATREAKRQGLPGARFLDLAFWVMVAGIAGARLLYVLQSLPAYARLCAGDGTPRAVSQLLHDCAAPLRLWDGGLVFYGGALAALLVVVLFTRREGWSPWTVADAFAPGLALGHAIGRLGCFAAGCCYGKAAIGTWGTAFPPGSVAYDELRGLGQVVAGADRTPPLHPTQLYEAAEELLLFGALVLFRRRPRHAGAVALAYGAGYAGLRFILELWRGDPDRHFLMEVVLPKLAAALRLPAGEPLFLSTSQAVGVAVLLTTLLVWHRRRFSESPALPFDGNRP